jgi:hypothetical protein
LIFTTMGIVTVGAFHPIQICMDFILQDLFKLMAMETEGLAGIPEQFHLPGGMGIMAGGAVSACHGPVQNRIGIPKIIMAHITESRLRLHHASQRAGIVAGTALPFPVRVMDHDTGHLLRLRDHFPFRRLR